MGPIYSAAARHWLSWLAAVTLATSAWLFVADLTQPSLNSYQTFYYAARALESQGELYASHAPGKGREYVYPPLFAFVSVPLCHLPVRAATRVWLGINVALTCLALALSAAEMMRRFQLPRGRRMLVGLCAGGFWLSVGEIKTEWATGQTDTLILITFVLALRWLDRLPVAAGFVLGFAANIKYQTLVAVPWLVLRRRWKAAAALTLATVGCMFLPAVMSGWAANLRNLRMAFAGLVNLLGVRGRTPVAVVDIAWLRSVSITSAMARALERMHGNSAGALALGATVAVVFLGVVAWIYRAHSVRLFSFFPGPQQARLENPGLVALEWVGLMVAWLAFGPEVSRRHMFVLIPCHVAVLAVLASPEKRFRKKPLMVGLSVWQLGLRLPPTPSPIFPRLGELWNGIGGPSWCLLFLFATLVWSGLEWVHATRNEGTAR